MKRRFFSFVVLEKDAASTMVRLDGEDVDFFVYKDEVGNVRFLCRVPAVAAQTAIELLLHTGVDVGSWPDDKKDT